MKIKQQMINTIILLTKAAALPQSLATLAKGWISFVTKSTVASIAVLRSSTAKTITRAITITAHSLKLFVIKILIL